MIFPFLCVDFTLSEQFEHLSAAAHLVLTLYRLAGPKFIPTNLFLDVMLMIKNAYFCLAKAIADNPQGSFWLILLGTDRLEELFGILRTMVGNDSNMDMTQMVSRLGSTTEVANILAKDPHWDRSPRRLKLSAITRESKEIPDSADHIKPAAWKGNLEVKNVSLQTAWKRGRRALARYSKYRKEVSSTDCLRRVQQVERYTQNSAPLETSLTTYSQQNEELIVEISDPITSVVCVDSQVWLCVGEVNGLKLDGVSVDCISFEMLQETTVVISYQMLGLRPATSDNDPTQRHDWRTSTMREQSFTVPGRLIQSINPTISMNDKDVKNVFYLLESTVLVALAASLFQTLETSDLKSIPKMAPTLEFPYREASDKLQPLQTSILHLNKYVSGKSCFLCEDSTKTVDIGRLNTSTCPVCSPEITLDLSQGQRILEHIGAHILFDPKVDRTSEPCFLCLRPAPLCQFFLTKGKGARGSPKIDQSRSSGCPMRLKFSYSVAAKSSASSPCSNVPVQCPLCPKSAVAVAKYNLKAHLLKAHPNVPVNNYESQWKLSSFEHAEMKNIWAKRQEVSVKRPKRSNIAPLVVSDAHRSGNPARYVFWDYS
jgi:hypothetical protein